jgi:ribosomal protein L32
MTHYTSTTQGTCARCGQRTTRSKLCRDCGRDEHREANLTDTDAAGPTRYECVDCGATFRAGGLDPCPDCDSYRHTRVSEQ